MRRCPACGSPAAPGFRCCSVCGTSLPADLQTPAAPSLGAARRPVWPVLTVLLALALLLAAVTYYASQTSLTQPALPTYHIDLAQTSLGNGFAVVTVGFANPAVSPNALKVGLSMSGDAATPAPLPTPAYGMALTNVEVGGLPYLIEWQDLDRSGTVSTGDVFGLGPTQMPPVCCRFLSFAIFRGADGAPVASISFYMPPSAPIPTVTLADATQGTSPNAAITIDFMDPPTAPEHIVFGLSVGNYSSWGDPIPSANTAANRSVGDAVYLIAWNDNNHDALLDAGDAFNVTFLSGIRPVSGTLLGFELDFTDGWWLAGVYWTA